MFWIYCLGAHLLLLGIVMQARLATYSALYIFYLTQHPNKQVCDVYLLALAAVMQVYALYNMCLPKGNYAGVQMTRENMYLLAYVAAGVLVFGSAQKPDMLLWIVMLDYALGIGHTWDREATVDTIVNCRLFYMCSLSLLLCVYYTMQ